MIILRPYQEKIIDECRTLMRQGVRSMIVQLATGGGKTCLTASMMNEAAKRGIPSLFVVHRKELLDQSIRAFSDIGLTHGVIAAGYKPATSIVQIANIATLRRRLSTVKPPRFIVIDECQHALAETWAHVIETFPEAFLIGNSATPSRLDGKGLGKFFSRIICGPSVRRLQEDGYLSYYRFFAPPLISTEHLRKRAGEFVMKGTVETQLSTPKIVGDAIKTYQKFAAGKRAIVFCATVEHSKQMALSYREAGITAEQVDGKTTKEDRAAAIARFRSGETTVLTNVELFGEGFDVPAVECVQQLRPTCSLVLHRQQIGRALRPYPGKEKAIILDHVGNTERHGLPDDDIEWSLEGSGKNHSPSVRICPVCFYANESGSDLCAECGSILSNPNKSGGRGKIETIDGELEEINIQALRRDRKREQGKAQTLEDLIRLGKARGYKAPYAWAKHLMKARGQKYG